MLRNAEKFLGAVAGADYALNGDDSGGGALSALRQAQDALSGVRHLDDAFGQLYERLGRRTVKFTTSRPPWRTSGASWMCRPVSWTGWRAGWTCCIG